MVTNVSVSLNVNVTNNLQDHPDAVLVINENNCTAPVTVGGSGIGVLASTPSCDTGATAPPAAAPDQRFQDPMFGTLAAANRLEWNGIHFPVPGGPAEPFVPPITPGGSVADCVPTPVINRAGELLSPCNPSTGVIRITSMRANASQLGPFSQIQAFVSITGPNTIPVSNNVLNVAIPLLGLLVDIDEDDAALGLQCEEAEAHFTLQIGEGFATAFKPLGAPTFTPGNNQVETGYFAPDSLAGGGGVSQATRFLLRFFNIPEGVNVEVEFDPDCTEDKDGVPGDDSDLLDLVVMECDEVGDICSVASSEDGVVKVDIDGGFGAIVYEVEDNDPIMNEDCFIDIWFNWTPDTANNLPLPGTGQLAVTFAPLSTEFNAADGEPVPRFIDTGGDPTNVITISSCPEQPPPPPPPRLVVSPNTLSFDLQEGSEPASQPFTLRAINGKVRYSIRPASSWLSASPDEGVSDGETDAILAIVNPQGLAPGTYSKQFFFRENGVLKRKLEVILNLSPTELTVISDSPLPTGMIGQPYAEALSAVGGAPPYTWSVVLGALPPGLTLDPTTGSLKGNPTVPGTFRFAGLVTDTKDDAAATEFLTRIELDPNVEPQLGAQPNRLTFSFVQVSPAATKKLSVLNDGGGSLGFQVETVTQSGGPWLMVSPTAGETTAAQPGMLNVTADPASLAPGTYFGKIQIVSPSAQQSRTVPVAMAISGRSQLLRLSQTGLTFTGVAGGGAVPVQNLRVFNDGLGVMAWGIGSEIVSGGDWLTVTPQTGASEPSIPGPVDVAVSTQGLTPGAYYGLLEVAAPVAANSPRFVTVVLNLLEANRDPGPIVDPRGLIFASTPADPAPSPQSFRISNLTSRSIAFTLQGLTLTGGGWLSPTAARGIVSPGEPASIGVQVRPEGLGAGIYRGLVRLQFDGGLTRAVEVLLVVSPEAGASLKPPARVSQGACSRTEVAPVFKVLGGTSRIPAGWPASIEVEVVDNCANKMTAGSVVLDFASIASPSLALAHAGSGLWTETWNVPALDARSMATVTVTATDPAGVSGALTQALSVSPNSSSPPRIAPAGVVHGASFVVDPLAPGTMVSIFGSNLSSEPASGGGRSASGVPLPTELAGTQMILGGRPLPILFSREDQVNAILPFELTDRLNESLPLLVRRTDAASLGVSEPVFVNAARPGVFTRNASGSGPGSIQNANFQIVTPAAPVKAGDAIVIYGTGLGAVSPEVASGDPAPASPLARTAEDVTVTIGGRPASVLFAGLTPGFTSLYQVNAVVPAGVPAGEADLVVSIAGQASPVVTLAVE